LSSSTGLGAGLGGFRVGEFVQGDKEIDRLLADLKANTARKILISSVNAGMGPVVREIRREMPSPKNGRSRRYFTRRIGKSKVRSIRKRGWAKAGVGVGKPQIKKLDLGGWIHTIATGTEKRTTSSGRSTGRIQKNKFVSRGARRASSDSVRRMRKKALTLFDKETKKLARKHKTRRI